MSETGPDIRHVPKAGIINEALGKSPRPPVGVIISRALEEEIRATRGWISRPAVVDPTFQPNQFEVITNEGTWETRTVGLNEAILVPLSAYDKALIRTGIGFFVGAVVGLCIIVYFVFIR